MGIILGISLALNGLFIGLYCYGVYLDQKHKKIFKENMEKQAEGFTKKYIEIYKDYLTNA